MWPHAHRRQAYSVKIAIWPNRATSTIASLSNRDGNIAGLTTQTSPRYKTVTIGAENHRPRTANPNRMPAALATTCPCQKQHNKKEVIRDHGAECPGRTPTPPSSCPTAQAHPQRHAGTQALLLLPHHWHGKNVLRTGEGTKLNCAYTCFCSFDVRPLPDPPQVACSPQVMNLGQRQCLKTFFLVLSRSLFTSSLLSHGRTPSVQKRSGKRMHPWVSNNTDLHHWRHGLPMRLVLMRPRPFC